jgi:hypothetical protein
MLHGYKDHVYHAIEMTLLFANRRERSIMRLCSLVQEFFPISQ